MSLETLIDIANTRYKSALSSGNHTEIIVWSEILKFLDETNCKEKPYTRRE